VQFSEKCGQVNPTYSYTHIHVEFYLKKIRAILCPSVIVAYDSIPGK